MEDENKQIPKANKKIIVSLRKEGKSLGEIVKIVKRPRSSIQYVLEQF